MKIRLETEAKLYIQAGVRAGRYLLVWSYMLDFENAENPYEEKQRAVNPWKNIADEYCASSGAILSRGTVYTGLGIKPKDALHISCAVESGCDYFITTDRKLLNKKIDGIKMINPIDFITETEGLQ
jgi:predicted nucleic acid-binding protein